MSLRLLNFSTLAHLLSGPRPRLGALREPRNGTRSLLLRRAWIEYIPYLKCVRNVRKERTFF